MYYQIIYRPKINKEDDPIFNREVCINKLGFDENGTSIPLVPAISGVQPLK